MRSTDIEKLIAEAMPEARVTVRGEDGRHFEAVVVSDAFAGKTRLQQHRMVYRALGGKMESQEIHALALKTYTPDDWSVRDQ